MTLDLEQARLIVESLNKRRPGHLTPGECSQLLAINCHLIAEVEQKDIVLSAWQSIFGTSQLSHAQARLESAEREVERLEQRWGESVDLVSEVEERAQKAERQVCQLRGALELILPHARDYVGKHEVGSNRRYVEIAEQALASTSRCGHKEHDEAYQKVVKAFESGADGILALVNEIIEQRGMKDWLTFNAKHGPNCMPDQFCDCGLKELLK